jgi:hypothetical protein
MHAEERKQGCRVGMSLAYVRLLHAWSSRQLVGSLVPALAEQKSAGHGARFCDSSPRYAVERAVQTPAPVPSESPGCFV